MRRESAETMRTRGPLGRSGIPVLLSGALAALAPSCGGPPEPPDSGDPADVGIDAAVEATDIAFDAVPDDAERTDCARDAPAPGRVIAKHISCDAELVPGALAMGRVGDIVLESSLARFVVRADGGSASMIGGPAGGVIDAAPARGSDFLKEILPLFDLSSIAPTAVVVIDAGGDAEARVRVLFEDAPLGLLQTVVPGLARPSNVRGQIDYVLRADEPFLRIEISTTTRAGIEGALARSGLLLMLGGQEEVQPGIGVLEGDTIGGEGHRLVAEREDGALAIGLSSDAGASLARIDTIHLLQGSRVRHTRGEITRFSARLAVGATAADAYGALAGDDDGVAPLSISGPRDDRVEITRDGAVLLRSRLHEDGTLEIPLPPGTYDVRAGFDGFFEAPVAPVAHDADGTLHTLTPAPAATLRIDARVEGAPDVPVRVTVERDGDELARFVATGITTRHLPPGAARVTISHGLEHDAVTAENVLGDGLVWELTPDLDRALDTTGWVSVDLHLHSEFSTDSTHRIEDALRMIAAENVEVVSSTDHDFVNAHARHAVLAGVEGRAVLVSGEEVSTTVFGHVNGYPLRPDPATPGAGAVPWFGLSPAQVFAGLRERGEPTLGGALVQINHPRLDQGFFDAVGLDPETGHATATPGSLDLPPETDLDDFSFDVLEVWNGYTRGDNEETFADYLALFAAGRRFTMVGNSDTHRPTLPAGSPRSFVRVPDDAPGAYDWTDVATSLRAGDVTVAGGIFVTAELAGPRAGGTVPVHVRVQAAPWVEVDRLRVYAGRSVAIDRPLTAVTGAVRLDETLEVPVAGESFVVVRADGSREPEPLQHFSPFGVTNAIEVP